MNERIRELAFECARQLNWNPPSDPKEYTFSSAGLEKFAELIVRECAELCDRFQERDVGMQPAECAGAIRKMFGVEE